MSKLKKFFVNCYNEICAMDRSVRFWNGLLLVVLILSIFLCPPIFMIFQCFGSIIALAIIFDGNMEKEDLWMFYTVVPWFGLLLVGIGYSIYFVYKHTILRFNKWLNNKTDEDE